ncbi:hypothetical protein BDV12DRAFT_171987 [Aspergillus spectabilis]
MEPRLQESALFAVMILAVLEKVKGYPKQAAFQLTGALNFGNTTCISNLVCSRSKNYSDGPQGSPRLSEVSKQ